MVWVSNRSSQTIKVAITNKAGGDPSTFEVIPEPLLVETSGRNLWGRQGPETATVTYEKSGAKFQVVLTTFDVLLVYEDAYIVQPSTKQHWFST